MLTLIAQPRTLFGKKTQALRERGFLPAILYGKKRDSLPLQLNLKEFKKVYAEAGENMLVALEVKEKEKVQAFIHDVERDPVSGEFIHADFYQPSLTEKVEANIPLIFEGEARAVEELKGVLIKNITELTVRALPLELPRKIKVNLAILETFGDQIRVRDLIVPAGVEILIEPAEVVASVSSPEREIEKQPAAEPVEPEVIGRQEKKGEATEE